MVRDVAGLPGRGREGCEDRRRGQARPYKSTAAHQSTGKEVSKGIISTTELDPSDMRRPKTALEYSLKQLDAPSLTFVRVQHFSDPTEELKFLMVLGSCTGPLP